MKKLLSILLAVLMLCSCGVQEEPVLEEPGISEENPGENCDIPEEVPEKTEDEIYYESLDNEGKNMYSYIDEKAIDYNTWTKLLSSEYGIGTSFKNIRFVDDWYYSAVLVLQKYGTENTVEIPVTGVYYHSEFYGSRMAPFGGFCYPYNGKVYFCGLGKIVEIDPENFTATELELDHPKSDFDDLWINGIFITGNPGEFYVNASGFNKKSLEKSDGYLWTYDRDGNIISEITTENSYCTGFEDIVLPMFARETEIIEKGDKTYLLRTGTRYVVDAKTGEKFYFSDPITLSSEGYKLELTYYYSSDEDYSEGQYFVTLLKNAELVGEMDFENDDFVTADNIDEAKPRLEILKDGKTAVYICDYFAMNATFDFEKGTSDLEFDPTDKNITDESYIIDSPDGKYSVCSFGGHGGGDVYHELFSVRDNKTGEHKYIGKIGGMYGGTCGVGFLKNNDVYIFRTDMLHISDPATGEVKFDLNRYIPLGYDSETDSERGILTFRRDPENFTYILVYYEYENGFEWDENFRGSCNYMIGFLDIERPYFEAYDTGCALYGDPFGLYSVDMKYSEKELKLIGTGGKGGKIDIGTFDLETKEFKAE